MANRSRPVWARYGVAAASVAIAAGARWVLHHWFDDAYPFAPVLLAIIVSAWYGGFGPTITAAVLALGIGWLVPDDRPRVGAPLIGLLLYILFTLGIAGLGSIVAQSRQRIERQIDELARHREQLEATLRSIGDAVLVTDAAGRIVSLNPVAEQLTGWTSTEARGLLLDEVFRIVNEETRLAVESPVAKVLREGMIVGLANHTLLIAKDGAERPIDDSAAPVHDSAQNVAGVVLVFRDNSERRERERTLREEARRKDEFLALLAHELRNPLAPIANALEVLKLSGNDSDASAQVRDVAERQVSHLTRLVDDLLDVSRIMRGKVELRRERMTLSTVVAHAVETTRPAIDAGGHEFSISLPEAEIWLDADRVRLAQVLGNLLSNAAKYTETGGRIAVVADVEDGFVTMRVTDSGIGIAPEVLPRLFEMFMQAAPGTSRSHSGLGIGLALVKSLVEMHGGSVAAHSAGLGKGSEFVVRLPIAVEQRDAEAVEASPTLAGAAATSRRILVVDDNADAARSLVMLLKLRGHEVSVAYGGPEALEMVRENLPELVFLDIGMPGMDGYEVARALRADFNPSLQVIALTGWGTEQDRKRSRDAGFDQHLTKPVDLTALENVLTNAPVTASALTAGRCEF